MKFVNEIEYLNCESYYNKLIRTSVYKTFEKFRSCHLLKCHELTKYKTIKSNFKFRKVSLQLFNNQYTIQPTKIIA